MRPDRPGGLQNTEAPKTRRATGSDRIGEPSGGDHSINIRDIGPRRTKRWEDPGDDLENIVRDLYDDSEVDKIQPEERAPVEFQHAANECGSPGVNGRGGHLSRKEGGVYVCVLGHFLGTCGRGLWCP